jgi:hypothetical protein
VLSGDLNNSVIFWLFSFLLCSSLLFASCDSEPSRYSEVFDPEADQATSFYLPERTSDQLEVLEERYIYLEDTEESFITRTFEGLAKLVVEEQRLYILDSRKNGTIFCFDLDGKFLFKINDVGSGPDEYLEVRDFSIHDGKIYLLEAPRNQLFIYDAENGGFLGKSDRFQEYLADEFEILDGNIYLLARSKCKGPAITCYGLYVFDFDTGVLEDRFHAYSFLQANYGLRNGDYLVKTDLGIQYYLDFSNLFYDITITGEERTVFHVNPFSFPLFKGGLDLFKNDMERYTDEVVFNEDADFFTSYYKLLQTNDLQFVRFSLGRETLNLFLDKASGRFHLMPKWMLYMEKGFVNSAPVSTYGDWFVSVVDGDFVQHTLKVFDESLAKASAEEREEVLNTIGDHMAVLEPMRDNFNPLIVLTRYAIKEDAPTFTQEVISIK